MYSIFDQQAVADFCSQHAIPAFRIKQIYHEIFKNAIIDFQQMTTLPAEVRTLLAQHFCVINFSIASEHPANDTIKFLLNLADDKVIEMVIMKHYHRLEPHENSSDYILSPDGRKKLNRLTLCISTQVGCPVGCIFCVTGKLGLMKNLDYPEIIGQIIVANHWIKKHFGKKPDWSRYAIRNVVFMGMGEPLLNYDNLVKTIRTMIDQKALGLSKRHITISTSGIIDGIDKLIRDQITVMLALSLHAPNQDLREKLIPTISKRFTLPLLMEAIDRYTAATGNRIFYEYIMIKNMTDSTELAHQLGVLLQHRPGHVNLIPYNPNPAMPDLQESDRDVILNFQDILQSYHVTTTIRDTLWRKVKGACGQLGYEKLQSKLEQTWSK
jgi:23S rRNA (adenine2503-C2)-methyltransferase